MRLYCSAASPFARKVRAVARERGLAGRIEEILVDAYADPPALLAANPAGKLPTLVLDDGESLYDSPVVCAYLDALPDASGARLIPPDGMARWRVLRAEALGDAAMDLGLALTLERRKPAGETSPTMAARQRTQLVRVVAAMAAVLDGLPPDPGLGQLTIAIALDYLDLRHPDLGWRNRSPALAAWHAGFVDRDSLAATAPP